MATKKTNSRTSRLSQDEKINLATQRIKGLAKTNKITFTQALDIVKLQASLNDFEAKEAYNKLQSQAIEALSPIIPILVEKINEMLSPKKKFNDMADAMEGEIYGLDDVYPRVIGKRLLTGTIVHFYPNEQDIEKLGGLIKLNGDKHLPAMVIQKFTGNKINLVAFAYDGTIHSFTSVENANNAVGKNTSYWISQEVDAERNFQLHA